MSHEINIKQLAARGVVWSAIERFGNQAGRFILGLILARILTPSDYGLIGMLTMFIVLGQVLLEGGLPQALIQRQDVNDDDFSSIFWFNAIIGIAAYAALVVAAESIAAFYREPDLVVLTRVVGLNIVINSMASVQRARLVKAINFKAQARVSVITTFFGGLLGILLGLIGFGVWALVIQTLSRATISTILLWYSAKWLPSFKMKGNSLKKMFSFSMNQLGSTVLSTTISNSFIIVIGRVLNASHLGIFTRAYQLERFPEDTAGTVISRVFFPVFSKIQDDKRRTSYAYLKAIGVTGYLTIPMLLFLVIIARPFITLILTDKWSDSILLLQILALGGFLNPIHNTAISIILATGDAKAVLVIDTLKFLLMATFLVLSYKYGLLAITISVALHGLVASFGVIIYSSKIYKISVRELIKELFNPLFASILSTVVTFIAIRGVENLAFEFILGCIMCPTLYVSISAMLHSRHQKEMHTLLSSFVLIRRAK